jgi:hypothetical protein
MNNNIKSFEKFNENLNDDPVKALMLLKERISNLKNDLEKIDTETVSMRLEAMYNQVDRIINSIK